MSDLPAKSSISPDASEVKRSFTPTNTVSGIISGNGYGVSDKHTIPIVSPNYVQQYLLPATDELSSQIYCSRDKIFNILSQNIKQDYVQPLLVVTGPSALLSVPQAKACGSWVQKLFPDDKAVFLSMRTNLKSYNKSYAPLDSPSFPSIMTFDIAEGIPECRDLLYELAQKVPLVGDVCDLITPQFFHDLFSLGSVSSTLAESQLHREMISACSFAVGVQTSDSNLPFDKQFYSYKVASTLDAMYASSQPHQFLNITKAGLVAVVGTVGNPNTFVILEVNSQLNLQELKQYIDQIYNYPKHNNNIPKVMLDLGKVDNESYSHKLSLVQQLFADESIAKKINGVMIDSGDKYDTETELTVNTEKIIGELSKLSKVRMQSA